MAVKVVITLPSPDDVLSGYAAGAKLRIQSASSEAGSFADLASPTISVVAATYQYEVWDAAGDGTTWYRWRPENSGGTETGDWSPAFQGLEAAAAARASGSYASLDDLLLAMPTDPVAGDTRRLARMEQALVETAEMVTAELGWDAFRAPQTGSSTFEFHGPGGRLLHVHRGIVAVSLIEVRQSTGGTWQSLAATDWWLEGQPGELTVPPGEPYFHVRMSDLATYGDWPAGENRIRLTGALGWPRPSSRHVAANVAWARQVLAADPSFPGGIVGPTQLGSPVGTQKVPDAVWRLARREAARFKCAV